MIEDLGGRVASVWEGLRPATRSKVERAMQSATPTNASARATSAPYDARAEWELSRLLAALDERAADATALDAEQSHELSRIVETCALVLHNEARSAEVFAQLLERALRKHNYARVDALSNSFPTRLAPTEVCELARHPNPSVRAIAQESLAQLPTSVLVDLLDDPVDADVARDALEAQADEYDSEEARWVVNALERADLSEDEA